AQPPSNRFVPPTQLDEAPQKAYLERWKIHRKLYLFSKLENRWAKPRKSAKRILGMEDIQSLAMEPRLERLQRALLFAEEFGLGLALPLTLERVTTERSEIACAKSNPQGQRRRSLAIERVVGDFLLSGFKQFGGKLVGVDTGENVIREVLHLVGISSLSRGEE
ncbi:MAG: hypothetical protein ABI680_10685, partial [Chthoniobacteraceae bacterium]